LFAGCLASFFVKRSEQKERNKKMLEVKTMDWISHFLKDFPPAATFRSKLEHLKKENHFLEPNSVYFHWNNGAYAVGSRCPLSTIGSALPAYRDL
jgi:hypothetical protein